MLIVAFILYLTVNQKPKLVLRKKIKINEKLKWQVKNPFVLTYLKFGEKGNTGNQMFELATLLALAKKHKCQVWLPQKIKKLEIWQMFDLSTLPILDVKPNQTIYEFENFEDINLVEPGVYNLTGFRQCPFYFDKIKEGLEILFKPKDRSIQKANLAQIIDLDKPWIAIHIRRGDSIKFIKLNKIWPGSEGFSLIPLTYYSSAIQKIKEKIGDVPVIVCTDDPAWVKLNLEKIDKKAILNPICSLDPKMADFLTLYLAKYKIIANSTFSWWTAYQDDNFVIAPYPWFSPKGLIPKSLNIVNFPIWSDKWKLVDINTGEYKANNFSLKDSTIPLSLTKMIRGWITS